MHFSKTFDQVLQTLPEDLQDSAIEYKKLKKLIKEIVSELESLGLGPAVLQDLTQHEQQASEEPIDVDKGKERAVNEQAPLKVVYEVVGEGDHIEPRLRLWVSGKENPPDGSNALASGISGGEREPDAVDGPLPDSSSTIADTPTSIVAHVGTHSISDFVQERGGNSLFWAVQRHQPSRHRNRNTAAEDDPAMRDAVPSHIITRDVAEKDETVHEVVIPLTADTAFFDMLSTTLRALSDHLSIVQTNFISALNELSDAISLTARPLSQTSSFQPRSVSKTLDPKQSTPLLPPLSRPATNIQRKSDLYSWRAIFQLYMDAEVFESMSEFNRGERSAQEAEERLKTFAERVGDSGLSDARKLKSNDSRLALKTFFELNLIILNLKKFQEANAEAIRKILKKHAKRTALPLPTIASCDDNSLAVAQNVSPVSPAHSDILALLPIATTSLPRTLVQAIGEILLPVIPHVDDYSCVICMNIAFKPIRLECGHLFCARCLLKMQRKGKEMCPVCRAPTVLKANRSNVDYAMLNFMQDWFPIESNKKLKQNEREAGEEQLAELGWDGRSCVIA